MTEGLQKRRPTSSSAAWESGLSYQGKTTIVSGNVIRRKAAPERADGPEVTEVAGA